MPTIAAIQMCSSDNVDENLKSAERLMQAAANNGAQLIVLPEMFAIIGKKDADKLAVQEKYGAGKIQDFLSSQAKKLNAWIVGGTIPISCDNKNKISAACIVYDNHGNAVARYDKIHLFDVIVSENESYRESATTKPGHDIVVIDTPLGKLGLVVCYDIRFPTLFTKLLSCGAEMIATPAAFTVKTGQAHWELLMRARAVDTFSYVIGAAQGGTHANGRQTYGHTLIVEPWGNVIQEMATTGEGIVYAEVDLKKLHEIRAAIPIRENGKRVR